MSKKLKETLKTFKDVMLMGEMRILPGQLAYYFILAMIPLLLLFVFIISKITSTYDLTITLNNVLPEFITNIVLPAFEGNGFGTNAVIVFILAFIFSSNGPYSIINTADMLYGIKDNNPLKIRIKALLMTIFILLILMFLIFVPMLGDLIVNGVAKMITHQDVNVFKSIYNILQYPISFIFIFINIKIIYTMAPNIQLKSKETTYGALFTTIGWILSTKVYGLYITKIANYSLLYGNFANVLILFIWIYVISYIFVMGMALNNNRYSKKA